VIWSRKFLGPLETSNPYTSTKGDVFSLLDSHIFSAPDSVGVLTRNVSRTVSTDFLNDFLSFFGFYLIV